MPSPVNTYIAGPAIGGPIPVCATNLPGQVLLDFRSILGKDQND